ncbi:hypothetical protein [Rhizobium sp. LEGMi135b]
MPGSIKQFLKDHNVLRSVVLPIEIDTLLSLLIPLAEPTDEGGGIFTGDIHLSDNLSKSPLPGLDLALTAPTSAIQSAPFKLKLEPTAFQFWLVFSKQGQVGAAFKLLDKLPGFVFTGAHRVTTPDGREGLEAFPADHPKHMPLIVSRSTEAGAVLGPALLISGSAAAPASLRFTPDTDSTEGVVAFGFEPPAVVFGNTNIGFECPAFVIDDSATAPPDARHGAPGLQPPLPTIAADAPVWRGFLARELNFYLPRDLPIFGGHAIRGYFALPFGPGGANLTVETTVPAEPAAADRPARLGYSLRIECLDPTASGMSGLVPTLITASLELPLDGALGSFTDKNGSARTLTFAAGKPVRVTATLSRDPVNTPSDLKVSIGVSAQGPDGILSVTSNGMGGAKIFNTVAALATALIADQNLARNAEVGDTKGVVLYALAAAGAALSSLFENDSRFVLHGVEIESSGHGAPFGGPLVLTLDYSVAARVVGIDLGALSVSMRPDQPMRIRIRKARMSFDPRQSGLSMIGLDFDKAEMEIENPGAWNVQGLESLFDVLGSRSGRGSSWIEIDLRFKLNLGPVHVSGATIRATLTSGGAIEATIRGLEAGLAVPGAIAGEGALALTPGGFDASLLAKIIPLNVNADAGVTYAPPKILLRLDVDLPAPIPLANTGFGLFGIGGLLGFSTEPDYASVASADPILRQLEWNPKEPNSFKTANRQSTFGFNAAVGTLPDLGFSFSAKAGLLITIPDVAVRGSLNGRVLQPAVKLADPSFPAPDGISFLGFIGVDAEALAFGVLGSVVLDPLLKIAIPISGRFPFGDDADDWHLYLGDDGRSLGPISARVLPSTLNVGADAYLMFRGRGIDAWPHGRAKLTIPDGFVAAFGFSVQSNFGVPPIAWAELFASLDLLLGAKPPTLAGFGHAGGSLHLGPFSLGVEAQINFMAQQNVTYFWAEVTGRIELLFFDIEGTVTLAFGDIPKLVVPPPDRHPLDKLDATGMRVGTLGSLTDDSYRVLAPLVEDPHTITDAMRVWPDAMISLPFAIPPRIATPGATTQFPGVAGPGATPPQARVGTEMLYYEWSLDRIELFDVSEADDPHNGGTKPDGQLSCRWQVPRALNGPGDVSELVLFSTSSTLWLNRLADGGKSQPGNPLKRAAEICQAVVSPKFGWAVGFLAELARPGFYLPAEPVSRDPLFSHVEATLRHSALSSERLVTPLDNVYALPAPYSIWPAELLAWSEDKEIKHLFHGHLVVPSLHWLDGQPAVKLLRNGGPFVGQQIALTLSEPITNGLLVLAGVDKLFGIQENFFGIRVFDDAGQEWSNPDLSALPTGDTAALYNQPGPAPVRQLTIAYPIGARLGVVGVGGITVSAAATAAAENKLIQDEVTRQQNAKEFGFKHLPKPNLDHQRVILEPGRLYRLDIDMSWKGELYGQDEAGRTVLQASAPDVHSTPEENADRFSTKRQLFFKTTPKPEAPAPSYTVGYIEWLRRKQDVFHPDMIERYLAGYEPAQSEQFRFCDDRLKAQFSQDHAPALAKAYGFTLSVALRRVDAPGDAYAAPQLLRPSWAFADKSDFLTPTDRERFDYALASPCATPTPGATASVLGPLEPQAWYEVYMLATSDDASFADSRLRGVTFRTSRWRGPTDMFSGLGFAIGVEQGAPVVTGDLQTIPTGGGVAPAATNDQDFNDALSSLGLQDWAPTESPRLSRLWNIGAEGAWLFAGLMVESPEPIRRSDRVDIQALTLEMGRAGGSVRFDTVHRDRSCSRMIFLANAPFSVITREWVRSGRPIGHGRPPYGNLIARPITPTLILNAAATMDKIVTPIKGSLVIPAAPSFAEDP